MKIFSISLAALFISASAFAYSEGTYHCKTGNDLVNDYRFETISLGNNQVPFVEATLRYRQNPEDKNSPVLETVTKGVAVLSTTGDVELLGLNSLHFEFVKGELSHCKQ